MDRLKKDYGKNQKKRSAGGILNPEDYMEPRCLLCDEPFGHTENVKPVPRQRIIEKMNEYMGRRDYQAAEKHLHYWLEEARLGHDLQGQLMLHNELAGHYRKVSDRERARAHAREILRLVDILDFQDSNSGATSYVNAATVFHAFGDHEEALSLFRKARAVYEQRRDTDPGLLGGLYNNMALCCAALGDYEEAFSLFERALETMEQVEGGQLEQAITCLNMADTLNRMKGPEDSDKEICSLLDRAAELLREPHGAEEGYYAFVCEKCAPAFAYHGYFLDAEELKQRADEIYARS